MPKLQSKKIFVDDTIFAALIDRSNTNHLKAVQILDRLAHDHLLVFTSQPAVEASFDFLHFKISKIIALEFLQAMLESNIVILFAGKSELILAARLLLSNRDQELGFHEALASVLMSRNNISHLATFRFWKNLLGTSVIIK